MCVCVFPAPNSCSDDNPGSTRNPHSHLYQLSNYTALGPLTYLKESGKHVHAHDTLPDLEGTGLTRHKEIKSEAQHEAIG